MGLSRGRCRSDPDLADSRYPDLSSGAISRGFSANSSGSTPRLAISPTVSAAGTLSFVDGPITVTLTDYSWSVPSVFATDRVGEFTLTPDGLNDSVGRLTLNVTLAALTVDIDIKPGSDPNGFNVNGHGVIPVAILGSSTFDVTLVDPSTLLFGGLAVRVRGNKGPLCNFEDSDGDTILDLVCHFEDDSTNWAPGDGQATLTGMLLDSTEFEGADSICVVP